MARSRVIRPEFFADGDLVSLPPMTRLLFIGLWTLADREGRLKDRPLTIKNQIFPSDECDMNAMLDALEAVGSIRRYVVEGERCIDIPGFVKHQRPHPHESASDLPGFVTARHKNDAISRDAVTSQNLPLQVRTCRDKGTPLEQEQEQVLREEQDKEIDHSTKGPAFSEFWAAYPNKEGKAVAARKWEKLSDADRTAAIQVALLMGLAVKSGRREREFCPHGSTFIHQRRWEDWEEGTPASYNGGNGNGKNDVGPPPRDPDPGYCWTKVTNPFTEELEWAQKRGERE